VRPETDAEAKAKNQDRPGRATGLAPARPQGKATLRLERGAVPGVTAQSSLSASEVAREGSIQPSLRPIARAFSGESRGHGLVRSHRYDDDT
jgi:hypothetical protein